MTPTLTDEQQAASLPDEVLDAMEMAACWGAGCTRPPCTKAHGCAYGADVGRREPNRAAIAALIAAGYEVRLAHAAASPGPVLDREGVARDIAKIIDPDAFKMGYVSKRRPHIYTATQLGRQIVALAKAEAILALIPPHTGGWEGIDHAKALAEGWEPIETAPKDGTTFDAWVPDAFGGRRMCNLSFNARGKLRQDGLLTEAELPRWPTHWQPLPSPPAGETR